MAIPRNPIYIAGNVVTGFEFPHVEILRGTRETLTAETSLPVTIFPAGGSSQHTARECLEPERTSVASGGCERPCRNVAIPRNPIYIAGNVVTGFEFPHVEILRGTRERLTAETSLPVTIFPAGGSSQHTARECLEPERTSVARLPRRFAVRCGEHWPHSARRRFYSFRRDCQLIATCNCMGSAVSSKMK